MNGGVRKGLNSLSQRIIGANTIVQGALPNILKQTPETFFKETLDIEYEEYLEAKSSCRAQNDDEYCLERGTCYPGTNFCRYCYSWTCAKHV